MKQLGPTVNCLYRFVCAVEQKFMLESVVEEAAVAATDAAANATSRRAASTCNKKTWSSAEGKFHFTLPF